jgi:hypothetical protein
LNSVVQYRGWDWRQDPVGEATGERWARSRAGIRPGRWLASSGAQPRGVCASDGRWGAGVVRATLTAACGKKNRVATSEGGGLGGEAGHATRRGREIRREPLGRGEGSSVLGLGYMGLVGSNVFMGFISMGTLG